MGKIDAGGRPDAVIELEIRKKILTLKAHSYRGIRQNIAVWRTSTLRACEQIGLEQSGPERKQRALPVVRLSIFRAKDLAQRGTTKRMMADSKRGNETMSRFTTCAEFENLNHIYLSATAGAQVEVSPQLS